MRALSIVLISALLCGCASQPTTQKESANTAAVMGMMLMGVAAQEKGSGASLLWQVRIPPAALDVLSSIRSYRRSTGLWPKNEDIALPDGITVILLQGTDEDMAVVMKKEQAVVMRCKVLKDGTVVAAPMFEDFMSAVQSRPRSDPPFIPMMLPSKK